MGLQGWSSNLAKVRVLVAPKPMSSADHPVAHNRQTGIVIVAGKKFDNVVAGSIRHREVSPATAFSIQSIDRNDQDIKVQLGGEFSGVTGLERGLLDRPELFVGTLAEKLLTYATGRGVEHFDATAIRKIVQQSETSDYRFAAVVQGVVESLPFQSRMTE